MFVIEETIVINRPHDAVFAFVSDPANAHQWQSVVSSKQWTSADPPGVGSQQRVDARWLGLNVESTNEYSVWDPPNEVRFTTSNGPFRIEEGIKLEPEGNSTKLTWDMRLESRGLFRLAEGFFKGQAIKTTASDLKTLKRILEQGSA
jgi:carbon monoxide dehydrogenase subunit G